MLAKVTLFFETAKIFSNKLSVMNDKKLIWRLSTTTGGYSYNAYLS